MLQKAFAWFMNALILPWIWSKVQEYLKARAEKLAEERKAKEDLAKYKAALESDNDEARKKALRDLINGRN